MEYSLITVKLLNNTINKTIFFSIEIWIDYENHRLLLLFFFWRTFDDKKNVQYIGKSLRVMIKINKLFSRL